MSTRKKGLVRIIVGLLLALYFALADVIGMGRNPDMFGFFQIVGTAVGVVILVAGVVTVLRAGEQ